MFDVAPQLPYTGWSKVEILDLDQMLSQSCGAVGVEVMKSTAKHDTAGTGCFTTRQFRKQIVIG